MVCRSACCVDVCRCVWGVYYMFGGAVVVIRLMLCCCCFDYLLPYEYDCVPVFVMLLFGLRLLLLLL